MNIVDAVIQNDCDTVTQYLEDGGNPNFFEDYATISLLHYAAQENAFEVACLLILAGADTSVVTEEGLKPIDVAILHNNTDIVRLLCNLR